MKQEQWNSSELIARAMSDDESRLAQSDVVTAPKLKKRGTTKLITPRSAAKGPRALERKRLLDALLRAKGRIAVTVATEVFYCTGPTIDLRDHEPHLRLREHGEQARVRQGLRALSTILAGEIPWHRPLLKQRLARIGQLAEVPTTRDTATALCLELDCALLTPPAPLGPRAIH